MLTWRLPWHDCGTWQVWPEKSEDTAQQSCTSVPCCALAVVSVQPCKAVPRREIGSCEAR